MLAPLDDEETLRQLQEQADTWDTGQGSLPSAPVEDVAAVLAQPNRRPLRDDVQGPEAPWLQSQTPQRPMSPVGNVDPGLAFMAAFSQNPVLQKMLDEQRNRPRVAAEEARQSAQDARAQEKWEQERDIFGGIKADKMRSDAAMAKAKVAAQSQAMDPNSEYTQTMKQAILAGMEGKAAAIEKVDPKMAEYVRAKAKGIAATKNLAAAQLLELQKDGLLGGLVKPIISQAHNAALESIAKGQLGLGWAREGEAARHNKAMEEMGTQKLDAKVQGNQDKLNEKIETVNNLEENLATAIEAKKHVDVGPFATPWNKIRQYTPWPNKDFNTLQEYLGTVRNEIKLLKSGKAVTPTEEKGLNEELANLEKLQDDPTFEQKLLGMAERIKRIKKRLVPQYQRKAGGETVDRSNTARESTQQAASLTPGEQEKSAKADRARKVLSDPNAPAKAKAGAQRWLSENGF